MGGYSCFETLAECGAGFQPACCLAGWKPAPLSFRVQLDDLLLPGGDKGVELGDLAGVVALLVLAKAEEVGFVLRAPAVEVQLVLGDDELAELLLLLGRESAVL